MLRPGAPPVDSVPHATCAGSSSHIGRVRWRAAGRRPLLGSCLLLLACWHAPLAHANRDFATILPSMPVWAAKSQDLVLNYHRVDPTADGERDPHLANYRGIRVNTLKDFGVHYGNVAIVRFGTHFISAVRKLRFYTMTPDQLPGYPTKKEFISVWQSSTLLCTSSAETLQPTKCVDFDPRSFDECLWLKGFEGTGVEDPRLLTWPGKGLYIMFGSKPWQKAPGKDVSCDGGQQFQQWLQLLMPYSDELSPTDPWNLQQPLRLTVNSEFKTEKNWNSFIYQGELFFSHSFRPHEVMQVLPNGTCIKAYTTPSKRAFAGLQARPRGNTNAIIIPAAFSGEDRDYYLGIIHNEVNRTYDNYFYKMAARPPFRIIQLSDGIPLIYDAHPRVEKWRRVAFPLSLELLQERGQLLIGYGSGDKTPRVKIMPWSEVQALFKKGTPMDIGTDAAER